MKEKIQSILENLKSKIDTKNKNLLFIIAGVIVLVPLSFWLLSSDKDSKLSFEKVQENKTAEYVPPKLDNPFKITQNNSDNNHTQENNTTATIPPTSSSPQTSDEVASFAKDKNDLDVQKNLQTLPNANLNQAEAIKQIAKIQKPKDMIAFLKSIQKDIDFSKDNYSFKYEMKEYKQGEKFLNFFDIETITANFIRFKDKNYAYNLRFLGE